MNLILKKNAWLLVLAFVVISLVTVTYHFQRQQQYSPENATYLSGLRGVTMGDEFKHNVPEWGEFWAPVFILKSYEGIAYGWGGNFENARIESISKLDNQTIKIYGQGIEFILQPEIGYRRISIDSNFLNSSLKDYPGWSRAKVGDVAEFWAFDSKAVFWQNRGEPLTFAYNLMHYHSLGNVTLNRGGRIYTGVGSFQHLWVDTNFYSLQNSLSRQDAFHVYTDKFVFFIQGGVFGDYEITDGCVYFLDDGSYDVLGKSVKGYLYQLVDGPNRLSYHMTAETHRGRIEVELTTPTSAKPMTAGFQQAQWNGVQARLDEKPVKGISAATETIRT